MIAKIVDMLKIDAYYHICNDVVAEVSCRDYDHFASLPDAIQINGIILGKTGWSSDSNKACYKTNVMLGKPINNNR
jgi:hypothetical protein